MFSAAASPTRGTTPSRRRPADSPMSAAAGIVVIEIATPTSAPDLPSVTESMPAAPAHSATTTE